MVLPTKWGKAELKLVTGLKHHAGSLLIGRGKWDVRIQQDLKYRHFIIMLMRHCRNSIYLGQLAHGKISFIIRCFASSYRNYQ